MLKCIVVEDDPFWSREIGAALLEANITVINAADGVEALEMARRHPDASMVLDMILPVMDGVEVLRQLGQIAPDMAVLAVTAGGRLGAGFYLKLAETFGAKRQLAKPFTAEQLVDSWTALAV
ncbi:response regulator transcription factor [Brevundimonas sp. TWP2-3-2]|uniref:response regulator transcription factor n=1 Tax=unclassified Brevundimonas TaxID=2622653 RepID=UPI003CF74A97